MNKGTNLTRSGALAYIRTLDDVVDDYLERYTSLHGVKSFKDHHDPVIAYTKKATDMYCAIARACKNRGPDGKMFAMGSCVRASARLKFEVELARRALDISRVKNFDALYDAIAAAAPVGIGPNTVYCAALRIGAFLGLEPRDYLYLHAGPLQGWRRLTGDRGSRSRVPWSEVPKPLRRLSPHRLEDCLCEFREVLHPGMMEES